MAYSLKYQLFRLLFAAIPSGGQRSRVIMNSNIFESVGNDIAWQPRNLPADPELISFHNNIKVASGVTFITHDIFRYMLNKMDYNVKFEKIMAV